MRTFAFFKQNVRVLVPPLSIALKKILEHHQKSNFFEKSLSVLISVQAAKSAP